VRAREGVAEPACSGSQRRWAGPLMGIPAVSRARGPPTTNKILK
jgi:hypothetical protein